MFDQAFFREHQRSLRWLFNQPGARACFAGLRRNRLHIPERIDLIYPNGAARRIAPNRYVGIFWTRPEFAVALETLFRWFPWREIGPAFMPETLYLQLRMALFNTVSTFSPAAGSGSTTADGDTSKSNATWDTARTGDADSASVTATTIRLNNRNISGTYRIDRGYASFATGDTINGGTVNVSTSTYLEAKVSVVTDLINDGNDFVTIGKPDNANSDNVVVGDHNTWTGGTGALTEQNDTGQRVDMTGLAANDLVNIDLNTTGTANVATAAGGITKLGWPLGHDATDTPPPSHASNENELLFFSQDHATEPAPVLSVDWTAVATGSKNLLLVGVG